VVGELELELDQEHAGDSGSPIRGLNELSRHAGIGHSPRRFGSARTSAWSARGSAGAGGASLQVRHLDNTGIPPPR